MPKRITTEAEWLACDDPSSMLRRARFRFARRKSRLFAVACCRRIWDLLVDERSRRAVEVAELHADGVANDEELGAVAVAAGAAHDEMFQLVGKLGACLEWAATFVAEANPCHAARSVSWAAATPRAYEIRTPRPEGWYDFDYRPCTVTRRSVPSALNSGQWEVRDLEQSMATGAERPIQAALIRCVFGNPFRPVSVDPAWLTPPVVHLAQAAYEQRTLPEGSLDTTLLTILADALEEAGCTNADILTHLRGPGPHVRGCWPIDLILRKK
ncbi:MAG TPA: hypothetical protein VEL76_29020 [Gemmataceae bacterium]|nr:hypothetical protein [Gemmataceae bacterium]